MSITMKIQEELKIANMAMEGLMSVYDENEKSITFHYTLGNLRGKIDAYEEILEMLRPYSEDMK